MRDFSRPTDGREPILSDFCGKVVLNLNVSGSDGRKGGPEKKRCLDGFSGSSWFFPTKSFKRGSFSGTRD